MSNVFANLRERLRRRPWRKVITVYLTRLPVLLAQDYGPLGPYTPGQVRRAIERYKLKAGEYVPYALAIFCERDDAARESLRAEIADAFFGGDAAFKVKAVRLRSTLGDSGSGWGLEGMSGGYDSGGGDWGGGQDGGGGHGGHG